MPAEAVDTATREREDQGAGLKRGCRNPFGINLSAFPSFSLLLFKRQLTDGGEGEETRGLITPCVALGGLLFLT